MILEIIEYSGIVMGIVGVSLMYKYSVSPNYKKGSSTYLYSNEEGVKRKIEEDQIERYYKRLSGIGFLLSIASILISVWVRALI